MAAALEWGRAYPGCASGAMPDVYANHVSSSSTNSSTAKVSRLDRNRYMAFEKDTVLRRSPGYAQVASTRKPSPPRASYIIVGFRIRECCDGL
jgi:hypothetical protein